MFRNHNKYQPFSDKLSHQFLKSENALGIGNLTFIWDHNKNQLILIMDTDRVINSDINASLKGNRLILEAPLISYGDTPFRTHLMGNKYSDEFEEELTVIGFSEVKLKYGYHYHLISCQVTEPKIIKVVLGFSFWGSIVNN